MSIGFTETQKERFTELGLPKDQYDRQFGSTNERNSVYRELNVEYSLRNKKGLKQFLDEEHNSTVNKVINSLETWLMEKEGFSKVSTPTIINGKMLDKMTITEENHLRQQVFWVDSNKCLRPMLAPNLYIIMRELRKATKEPVRIFEVGSCFRKESQGAQHLNEFTMMNIVELAGVEDGTQMERLEQLSKDAMKAVGIENYLLEKEGSTVYEETLDIVVDGVELASGSYGPHKLDENWGVFDTWVGIGFGIERLAMVKEGYNTIMRAGRNLHFVNGFALNV